MNNTYFHIKLEKNSNFYFEEFTIQKTNNQLRMIQERGKQIMTT